MVAATITQRLNDYSHDPGKEVVLVTASDSDFYISEKFGIVLAAGAQIAENDPRSIATAVSGATVTIHSSGLSSKKVLLTLYGIK